MAGILGCIALYIEFREVAGKGEPAGTFQQVQVATGSENVSLKIAVTGFRVGSLEDLSKFDVPAEFQNKTPYYIWFKAKVTSGSLKTEHPFPIKGNQWSVLSAGGETLNGVKLEGDLQPCPHISSSQLSAGEADEGCFLVFNGTRENLAVASLNLDNQPVSSWRF